MQKDKKAFHFLTQRPMIIMAVIAAVAIAASTIALKPFLAEEKNPTDDMPTFIVKQGPLRINVIESGTIKAREQEIIKSEVEGRTTILFLIPEGKLVNKGDLLVELDASKLLDDKIEQEIRRQNAEAAFIRARENSAVVKNQVESDKDKAKLDLRFAKLDLQKYLEGEYLHQLTEAESRIILAEEQLENAKDKLRWSETLFKEKYISESELKRDRFAENKAKFDLKLSKSDLWLLENFTYKRTHAALVSDVNQTQMALERTKRKTKADIAQAVAELRAKELEFERQKTKFRKTEQQIEKTKIYAPADGLVIYATSAKFSWRGNQQPLEEGQEVREREELIYLPTALSMKADVKIHESSMKKVTLGLPVTITVDALPDKVFTGRVEKIAPLPDAVSVWLNPDLKVYNTEIYIDEEDKDLRTGMSCKAEVLIEQYENATYIPLQAIVRVNGQPTVYVANGKKFEPRGVELGLDNNRMVRIITGLKAGEKVLLTPPLEAGSLDQAPSTFVTETRPGEDKGAERKRTKGDTAEFKAEQGQKTPDTGQGGFDTKNPTGQQRQKNRERFEKMSPEEREKMRQERRKRSPRDRAE